MLYSASLSHRLGPLLAAAGFCISVTASSAQEPNSLSETYGSWTLQCKTVAASDNSSSDRICQVSQELIQAETGNRVISAAFTTDPPKITLITPFGLLFTEGVRLSVAEKDLPVASFTTCLSSIGCIAERQLNAEEMVSLRSSQTLTLLMVSRNGQKLQANLSLDGFRDASTRLANLR
ncbi:invasion associated locus B family protein [Ruegeria sp. HKCCD8929]|uniref:invasion associated locus B family protein n=1 Tax=Ruegeria sp. HKCCD8929 TaxID=2683006 RepID=UPI001487EDE3|nr:invasion associated locus B family protein [Ruegeria sp. HKCCD8929]